MHRVKNMRSRVSDRHLAALGSVPCSIEDPITTNQNNIFGKRQDPNGAYAAVIPKWVDALLKGDDVLINGDGETSRDFCYIDNAVQANLLAATTNDEVSTNQVYNVAVGERTTLNQLYNQITEGLTANSELPTASLIHRDFRAGDVRHSLADSSKGKELLGYNPSHLIEEGLQEALGWYVENLALK